LGIIIEYICKENYYLKNKIKKLINIWFFYYWKYKLQI
jgi:hypothetical protein